MRGTTRDAVGAVLDSARASRGYTARMRRRWHAPARYSIFEGKGQLLNADGSVAWEDPTWVPNALTNDGQSDMLNVYLRASTQPANFYLGLFVVSTATTNVPSKTTHSADITQTALAGTTTVTEETVTSSGYARQNITTGQWGVPALNSGDEQSAAAQKTFGPATTGAWTGTTTQPAQIAYAFLSTAASGTTGTLILYIALAAATSVALTQSFNYTLAFKQS